MKSLIFLLFAGMAYGQSETIKLDTNAYYLSNTGIISIGAITSTNKFYYFEVLTIDSDSGTITFHKPADSAGIMFARWFQNTYSYRFDSLKQENTKLKFLYKEALRLAREYRKKIKE